MDPIITKYCEVMRKKTLKRQDPWLGCPLLQKVDKLRIATRQKAAECKDINRKKKGRGEPLKDCENKQEFEKLIKEAKRKLAEIE